MIHTGQDLKVLRKELGFSQRKLAAILDVDPLTVSRWETGKVPLPWVVVLAMKGIQPKGGEDDA